MDFSQFEPTTRRIAEQLFEETLVPLPVLSDELEQYVESLSAHAANAEFVDDGIAEKITALCWKLIGAMPEQPDERQHRLTQLAVNYFVLAEDGHDDQHSMIGFDDDLEVVSADVRELGMGEWLDESSAG